MPYLDVYPVTTEDMTTPALIMEASRLELEAAKLPLVGIHAVRYNFVKRELANRNH